MVPSILSLVLITHALLVSSSSPSIRTRNLSGDFGYDTWKAIRRALTSSTLRERESVQEDTRSLDKSWQDAVLFAYTAEQDLDSRHGNTSISAGIEITCTTCYVKGTVTTKFMPDPDFNMSRVFHNFTSQVEGEIRSLATSATDYVEEYIDNVQDKLDDGVDLDDFDLPPMDYDFNLDLPEIPEFRLQFQFDGLEMYMLIDTVLSAGATYSLNLYTSVSPAGFAVNDDIQIGVTLTLDLILSVEGEIDISSGFHLRLEDGVIFDIALFSKQVSGLTFNGGEFEFLPVTVESAGVVFKAVLRVGLQAGFEMASPDVAIAGKDVVNIGAGVEVGIFANIAEFITNVTLSPDGDETDCILRVEEGYQLAIGAAAGASVSIGDAIWGPVPETEIPIFYTTLADACAVQRSGGKTAAAEATVTSAAIEARDESDDDDDGLETATISTEVTFMVVACQSQGLVNCPASLQTTSKFSTTRTLITVVSAESDAVFPESIIGTVLSTIPFGGGAKKVGATSGTPRSYVPPSPTASVEPNGSDNGNDDGDDNPNAGTGGVPKRVIIGVSIGLGVPVLLGCVAAIIFWRQKRQSSITVVPAAIEEVQPTMSTSKTPGAFYRRAE